MREVIIGIFEKVFRDVKNLGEIRGVVGLQEDLFTSWGTCNEIEKSIRFYEQEGKISTQRYLGTYFFVFTKE